MQHHTFQCTPQSISSTQPASLASNAQATFQRRQKRPRRTARKAASTESVLSSSASSWGVADPEEEEAGEGGTSESDADVEETEATPGLHPDQRRRKGGKEPARKRRHLGLDDVGRFASLTIEHRSPSFTSADAVSPPNRPPASPQPTTTGLPEVLPTSVEEPGEDDDVGMRVRRGPTTLEVDKNRFFVTSLSDDSSDEEAKAVKESEDRVDDTLSSAPLQPQPDGDFIVNGELISRLKALESQRRLSLGRDRTLFRRRNHRGKHSDDSRTTSPTHRQQDQNSLVLWRKPDDLSMTFGEQASTSAPAHLVVHEGNCAYVQRPAPDSGHRQAEDAMDIDE